MDADGDHETLLMTSAPYAAAYDYREAEEREERAWPDSLPFNLDTAVFGRGKVPFGNV